MINYWPLTQKKNHKLDGNNELPFVLIAISCSESLLKTAWNLNNKLNINLKESEILIQTKDNTSISFPVFCDNETSDTQYYSLISNKSSGIQLVKELPNIDYILEISGGIKRLNLTALIKELKLVSGINAAIEVNAEKIKRKNPFCPF